jgi:hypothetical protein
VQVSWGQETAPRIGESSADKVRLACQQELHDFLARHPRFFGSCKKNAFFSKKKAPEAIWASRADKTLCVNRQLLMVCHSTPVNLKKAVEIRFYF